MWGASKTDTGSGGISSWKQLPERCSLARAGHWAHITHVPFLVPSTQNEKLLVFLFHTQENRSSGQQLRGLAQGHSLGRAVPRTQRGVRNQGNYKTYVSPFHTAWQKQDPTPKAPDFEPNVTSSRCSETPRPGQGKKSPDTAAPSGRGAWGTVHSPAPSPSELPLDCVVELGVPRAQPTFPVSHEGAGGAVPLS